MERFVTMLVAGGIALVVGLWAVELFAASSVPWLLGAALAALGCGGLLAGMADELDA